MGQIEFYQHSLPEGDQEQINRILQAAEETPARDKGLAIHIKAIETLRAKGYSYRDIAGWFSDKGIKVNHVDVWRAHKNSLEDEELFDAAKYDPEWKPYFNKKQDGNGTLYEEKQFDESGNELPPANAALSNPPALAPGAAHSGKNKKKSVRRGK